MKTKTIVHSILSLAAAAVLFTACGGDANTATVAAPAPAAQDAGSITITGNDQMKFDKTEFTVAAGSEVTLVFQNVGRMPKEAMGHNLVILGKGVDPMAFANAAMRHAANEYVAPDFSVIAATKVLGPGERETLTFTAPAEAGDYPFVCSFPGHTPAGMRGVMKVQ